MPVGSVPTIQLTPCITIALAIIILVTIVTRSTKLLLLGSSLFLLWCLITLLKYVYKRITAPATVTSNEQDGECSEEDKQVQGCP